GVRRYTRCLHSRRNALVAVYLPLHLSHQAGHTTLIHLRSMHYTRRVRLTCKAASTLHISLFFLKQKTAYEIGQCLEFRRVLFRSYTFVLPGAFWPSGAPGNTNVYCSACGAGFARALCTVR